MALSKEILIKLLNDPYNMDQVIGSKDPKKVIKYLYKHHKRCLYKMIRKDYRFLSKYDMWGLKPLIVDFIRNDSRAEPIHLLFYMPSSFQRLYAKDMVKADVRLGHMLERLNREYITPELIRYYYKCYDESEQERADLGITEEDYSRSPFEVFFNLILFASTSTINQQDVLDEETYKTIFELEPDLLNLRNSKYRLYVQNMYAHAAGEDPIPGAYRMHPNFVRAWEKSTGEDFSEATRIIYEEILRENEAMRAARSTSARSYKPEPDELLSSKDVPKSSLLKHGYSVRGFQGDRFGRIPGVLLSSDGTPFVLSIGGIETDLHKEIKQLPEEMFELMDMHGLGLRADLKRFIGWIGGRYTKDAMFISETQSDLMQRTWQFQTLENWKDRAQKDMQKSQRELRSLRSELRKFKREYQTAPARRRFELAELISNNVAKYQDANERLNRYMGDSRFGLHIKFAEYKSKIENIHKKWIEAFYHIAIWYAKHLKIETLFIAKSEKVARAWGRSAGDEDTIYSRAYDGIAQKLGASDEGNWWKLDISDFTPMENVARLANLISEDCHSSVILEGMSKDDIVNALRRNGYDHIEIVKAPEDEEYSRVDMTAGVSNNDQLYQLGLAQFDVNGDELDYNLSSIVNQTDTRLLSQDEIDGIEQLKIDSTIFIEAVKQNDEGQWVGVAIYSLDDPRFQFDVPQYRVEEDEPDESYIDAMSKDELEDLFSSPAYGEDPEAP